MASQRCFLGVLLNLAGVSESLTMQVDLKPGLREALQLELQNILEQGSLSSGQASKLRGRFQWASSAMYGRVARGGQGPLVRRQYEDLDELTPELKESLKFMLALLEVVSPREIPLSPVSSEVVILYTDASFEPGLMQSPGLGAVCMQRDDPVTRGLAGTVPEQVLNALEEREQQIAPLEAMAVLWATIAFSSHLRNRDVVWFIDNQAICAALVRGSSGCDDISAIVSLCHLAWASLSARVWIEYIPSDSNPSDGLSRDGLRDEWTLKQAWQLGELPCVPLHQLQGIPLVSAMSSLMHWDQEIHWANLQSC